MASRTILLITALLALVAAARASRILQTNTITLKEWEQCGGEGSECTKYGSNNCKDAPFVGYVCPRDFVCERGVLDDKETPNKWYWQCVKPTDDPEPTNPPEEEEEEQEEEPAEDIVLKEWEQCGGAGSECAKYGDNNCKDAAFVGYVCPQDFVCERGVLDDKKTQNKWYWQCVKAQNTTTPPVDDDDGDDDEPTNPPEEEEEEPVGDIELKEFEQCGGEAGDCSDFGKDNCKDAPFVGYVCARDTSCKRQKDNKYYWQCLRA